MINPQMKNYNYYLLGDVDDYGQETIPTTPTGTIKMAINLKTENTADNIIFNDSQYIGLTHQPVTDKYIIDYNGMKLKVILVNDFGRIKTVFMAVM